MSPDRPAPPPDAPMGAQHNECLQRTLVWFEKAVIGLNLCPFAKAVHHKKQIRWVHSDAQSDQQLLQTLGSEMQHLCASDANSIDTTVIVHPLWLRDFGDFNAFMDLAEALLEKLELEGVLQIASFHPQYQFAGTRRDDITNCSNRSPYPTLHLLREDSVSRAVGKYPETADIYRNNQRRLRQLGRSGWQTLFDADATEV